MEHKIVFLSWDNSYAVMRRSSGSGWIYIAKYLSKKEAETLLKEVTE